MVWIMIIIGVILYFPLIIYLIKLIRTDKLDNFKIISQGASWVLIPIVLAIIGFFIQNSIKVREIQTKEREIQTKYIELSINILKDSPTQERIPLRTWAFEVITRFSPFQMDDNLKKQLINSIPIFIGSGKLEMKPLTAQGNIDIHNMNGKTENPKK